MQDRSHTIPARIAGSERYLADKLATRWTLVRRISTTREEFHERVKRIWSWVSFASRPWAGPTIEWARPVGTGVAPRLERRFVLGAEGELMTASCGRIGTLVMWMQSDFLEDPELTLTLPQAQRRFDVDEITCKAVLGALVDAGVLANVHGGTYVRLFPRMARTAGAGARGRRQRPAQRQSAIRPFVGHAA